MSGSVRVVLREIIGLASGASCPFSSAGERNHRNRTEHGLSWLTAISDAGSTPAASTNSKLFTSLNLAEKFKCARVYYVCEWERAEIRRTPLAHSPENLGHLVN